MEESAVARWPSKWQRLMLWGLLVVVVLLFGAVVEYRSAFLKRRMTDADDYFRAAWAYRTGQDIYEVTDTNGWHYNYPPFLAIVIAPLANPPPDADRTGMLPYPLSVAIWYLFAVACLAVGVHQLATALEHSSGNFLIQKLPAGCTRWWALRLIPVLVCLPSIGRTLSRGQTNLTVLMLFCGMIAFLIAKRRALAGSLLAVAISIKLFPAYMLLYPFRKHDWRCIAGCIVGLIVCLIAVPVIAMGPGETLKSYTRFYQAFLAPAFTGAPDPSRAEEILNATATDSQAFMVILHNTLHPARDGRPPSVEPWVRATHWILAALMTGITFVSGPRHYARESITELLFFSALLIVMIPISPISHTHYFVFALPMVMALTAAAWEKNPFPQIGRGYTLLFAAHILMNVLSMLPGLELLKDLGLSLYGALILWAAGLMALRRRLREDRVSIVPAT